MPPASAQPEIYPMEGGCSCGAVRYRMEISPLIVHCCYCTWCQRETGSAFALNAMIETAHLTMLTSTAPAAYPIPSPSGDGQIMLRCPKCLIAVFSDYGGHPFVRMVRVGTLDHAAEVKPGVHIYTSTKCPWIDLSKEREAGVPIFEETYDKQQVWGPGALKRREEFLPKVMEYFEGLKKGNEEQAKGN